MKHVFVKRGHLFAHEKVLAQDKGGEKLFFFLKREKVDQKNFFLRKGFKEHKIFSVFFF